MDIEKALRCLSDKNRMQIVRLLSRRKYCVRALSKELGISESAVSQHIRLLKEAGLIERGDKNGYNIHYKVKKETLLDLSGYLHRMAENVQEVRMCGGNCRKDVK
jgi:ArsR family transcriptional regulator